jgi:predicted metalloprotease with PDZ domain
MDKIHYRVAIGHAGAHLYDIRLTVAAPDPAGQVLSLPAWIPGSYMIRDFARNIVSLHASSEGQDLQVAKLDKHSWRCAPCTGSLSVNYQVYAWELSVRAAHLDTTHAYFNGTSLFLRVNGQEDEPCAVELVQPDGPEFASWRVATSLTHEGSAPNGFGRYTAADYDDLIDHPVEIGNGSRVEFSVAGIPHEVVIYGRHRSDLDRLASDLGRICAQHVDLFGELPTDRYLFLVMALGEGYGGLEHKSSTSLICSRGDLPGPGDKELAESYRRFLGLCSHEYFHLWNVKRIQPKAFQRHRLDREAYTRLLWCFEGFTSYYDDLALVRSGVIDAKGYLQMLAQTITRVTRGPGRFKQSVAESSFDTWTKFYKQDENAPNAIVSYYAKGALVGLALDLTLRRDTGGRCSLDDVMRALWVRHGKTGIGVEEDRIERLVQEASGLDLGDFFARTVYGTEDPPLRELLFEVGVELRMRAARDSKDLGSVVEAFGTEERKKVLGVRLQEGPEALISHVLDEGAAQSAGLAAGDTIIAVDGIKATGSNLGTLIDGVPTGQVSCIHLFRRDELLSFQVLPTPAPEDTCDIRVLEDVPSTALAVRDAWLGAGSITY